MTGSSQEIISLINQYTSEIEELDKLSITYIMTSVGIIGTVLGVIATILCVNEKAWKSPPYRLVGPMFLSIPVIASIFLGAITFNCRKVATYRGYLVYLEQSYNQLVGKNSLCYNSRVLQLLSKWNPSNLNGSVTNLLVDISSVLLIILGFSVCFRYAMISFNKATKAKSYGNKKKWPFYSAYVIVILVCFLFCVSCVIDLIINSVSINDVLNEISALQP